jgi:hypothetical protein
MIGLNGLSKLKTNMCKLTEKQPVWIFIYCLAVLGCTKYSSQDSLETGGDNLPTAQVNANSSAGVIEPTQSSHPQGAEVQDQAAAAADQIADIQGDAQAEIKRLFGDWSTPDFAFFVSGRQFGYLEPCGCTGLTNQKGGLLRRHTLTKTLESLGWKLVKVDAGNQVRRFGLQPEIKFETTAKTLTEIFNYDAIGFGPDDLRLPAINLVSTLQNLDVVEEDLTAHPFVSCNVTIFADFADDSFEDDKLISTYKSVSTGGNKVCITAILGKEHFNAIGSDDLSIRSPEEGIEAVWPKMEKEAAEVNVLVAHTSMDDTKRIAEKYPFFDLVITAGGAGEPTLKPEIIQTGDHTTRIVQVGTKGMYAGVMAYYSEKKEFRYQRLGVTSAYQDSEQIKTIFKDYQKRVERQIYANLERSVVPHPSGATYVGSAACANCHADAHDVWQEGFAKLGDKVGPHTKATSSLILPNERNWVTRKFDPECLACHVTGWNPVEYYPYKTGYLSENDRDLFGNGCENCHGPGSLHMAAEENDEETAKYRKQVRVQLADFEERCMECHDLDNSPDFHVEGAFEKYWKRIDHSGLKE